MIFGSLKTKIAVNLAILLLLAMFLIDFIAVSTSQREIIRSEIARGELFIAVIQKSLKYFPENSQLNIQPDLMEGNKALLQEADNTSVFIVDKSGKQIYSHNSDNQKQTQIKGLIKTSISTGKKQNQLLGYTWGVFWKQKQNIMISAPVYFDDKVIAGIGIVLSLDRFYNGLRQSQQIVILYVLSNAILLTLFGLYRINKVAVKPIHKLVKRAEEYGDDSQTVFKLEKDDDDEFGQLSTALNRMLSRISDDKETLKDSLESLEKANLEIKKAQNDIIRAEKLASVGRLSAGIAHEIGNPIGIVLGYLGLLKQTTTTDDERKDYIDRAEGEINRINLIIRQLLDFSRSSKQEVKNISIHDIIDEVTNIIKVQPLINNINVTLMLDAEKDVVCADPNQLRQVLLNLILNAADAISSGEKHEDGEISIKTQTVLGNDPNDSKKYLLNIQVIDNGPGVSQKNIENIFDPFFTTKEPGKGTGLGLSVCFMIVEQIGGSISVQSTEGKGTTMTVNFPL